MHFSRLKASFRSNLIAKFIPLKARTYKLLDHNIRADVTRMDGVEGITVITR